MTGELMLSSGTVFRDLDAVECVGLGSSGELGNGTSTTSVTTPVDTGLSNVTVLEAESTVGGLAGAFETNGERLDRFYHHWFINDLDVMGLIKDLGMTDQVVTNPTNTGVFYALSPHWCKSRAREQLTWRHVEAANSSRVRLARRHCRPAV